MTSMIILITGVPGTGKTTISKILARKLQAHHVDVSKLVFSENFVLRKDVMRNTLIADLETLRIKLKKLMTNNKYRSHCEKRSAAGIFGWLWLH